MKGDWVVAFEAFLDRGRRLQQRWWPQPWEETVQNTASGLHPPTLALGCRVSFEDVMARVVAAGRDEKE